MQADSFKNEMARLETAYSKPNDQDRNFVYWQRLSSECTDQQFATAIDLALDNERSFPSIATLHGYIDNTKGAEQRAANESFSLTTGGLDRKASVQCPTCLDARWITVPSLLANAPSVMKKCPDCRGPYKGRRNARDYQDDFSAALYGIERDHARNQRPITRQPRDAAEAARMMRMEGGDNGRLSRPARDPDVQDRTDEG